MPNKSETPADAAGVGQPKREASLAAPNGYAVEELLGVHGRTPEDNARIELYNAAVAYAQYIMGDESNFDKAMAVAQRLEDAAENFVDSRHTTELSDAGGQSASASQKDVARPHSLQ